MGQQKGSNMKTGYNTEPVFQELVENSGDVFIVVDQQFKIRYISSAVSKLYGSRPLVLLGRNIFDFVSKDKAGDWRKRLENNTSGQSYEVMLELTKGTNSYFDVFVTHVQHEGFQGLMLKLHDITRSKLKEARLISSNKQLDQVIYKTTHDLKAPLVSALGLINLAEKAEPEEKQEYIELIKRSLLKLNAYIEEMNHFFKNDKMAIQRERIDMKSLFDEELEGLRNLYQVGTLSIQCEVDEKREFFSDLVRVRTIVTNILTNAIKYADPGKANPFVKLSATIDEQYCKLMVEDNGIGITKDYQNKIFDLFFRATSHAHGTGIGLFIVKDTLERLGGTVTVQSEPGIGTTFFLKIPNQLFATAALN